MVSIHLRPTPKFYSILMFFAVATLLATVSAIPADYQATSYVTFNDNQNSISHSQSGASPVYPALTKVTVPVVAKVAAPAAPVVTKYSAPAAPVYLTAPAYSVSPSVNKVALPVVAPVAKYVAAPAYHEEQYEVIPYKYAYAVQDAHTGDYHSQEEVSDGHHVSGQYSLHEADGTIRIVKYSDDGHGFNAVVEKQGEPTSTPAVYKKVVAVAAPHY
ncbi:cuticle protein 21-like [Sitophilus oryzae]|uniref:Cuticle protein 21-like n=1 Tax=Sitophilus oryzae TaxID=7048 RepID=A0A6J2XG82_SITOR|nr:cuticle protein 21-like [Sitophilus oryzae]